MNDRVVPLLSDEEANPYNARKDYNTDGSPATTASADELWVAPRPTKTEEPVEPATSDVEGGSPDQDQHDYKKRWVDLKKRYDAKVTEYRNELDRLKGEAQATETDVAAPETPEELDKFKNENPDLFKVVEQVAKMQSQQETQSVKEQLADIDAREQTMARKAAKQEVLEVHSDLDEITASDEFHDWAELQPAVIQKMIYENPNDSGALIRALDLYKADTSTQGTTDRSQSEEVSTPDVDTIVTTRVTSEPTGEQKKVWTRAEIAKMSPEVFDRYEDEIDLAIFEGRVTG